ncbi:TIGR01777 family oxidoreductase [Actinocorallia sp. A-T 12471]|uniref:TIGR01777 family oxidoreductase n=1 Tax=Actinocorallia sp. A-T 12471 TaxID=3089813 RepID=UPI0029D16850|nr:TIGR01777 family oxidoreductase [Actinocorallia sp. A-T 12471]MDX6743225.1 TIGR01777 family oxidoreductase [Actinocorallia sp. A-T 12471]
MRAIISGASGLIGGALAAHLRGEGFVVSKLVRREPRHPDEVFWDPAGGRIDASGLEGCDAVVHLAGAGVGDRPWTAAYKKQIRDSRVKGTALLAGALAGLDARPRVFVSGSAVGFYGSTGDHVRDEEDPQGGGFLAQVVADWEGAASPAASAGIRVVHPRTGIVLARDGGMLKPLLPLFRLGLGAKLGAGRQWMSWITLRDEVRALTHLISSELSGPVDLVSPDPVTNATFTKALAGALGRPSFLTVPAPALRLALREFADEGPLVSQRIAPTRLLADGFAFADPELAPALRVMFGR